MKTFLAALIGTALAAPVLGQVTIRSADMFSEPGQYYRAYAFSKTTDLDSLFSPIGAIPIRDKTGEPGGPQLWDFSTGPTNHIIKWEYINPEGTVYGQDFPGVTLAEKMTFESKSNISPRWLFIEQIPLVGRKVFGFNEGNLFDNASQVFNPPIVNFPDPMRFGDKWSTTVVYETGVSALGFDTLVRVTQVSEFEVDAWGYIELPNLGFGDALRVNEKVTSTQAVRSSFFGSTGDEGDSFSDIGKSIYRNLYFFRPGFGMVAHIQSTQTEADPGASFQEAQFFSRMFETNRTPPGECDTPAAVNDLQISINGGRALLKWSATECTDAYRVEYCPAVSIPNSWQTLGETQGTFMVDPTVKSASTRFYRVLSLKH